MLSLILFLLLLISFFVGFRRGFALQFVHLLGLIAALVVAYVYYEPVAEFIRLWIPFPTLSSDSNWSLLVDSFNLEAVYYNGIAFAGLFFITKFVAQIIASLFDFLAHLPILNFVNNWLGGALGFAEGVVMIAIAVHLAALLQVDAVQAALQSSTVAQYIFDYTPVVSEEIKDLWVNGRNG
ncbi:CvpA family protein [Paenalkalicoccus suaedae]|uniref:CvpA family protein n=1 Tax=Paenalkalicoccus suaedae TaxID=2592382 RepID=A0A859FFW4_9BACI|nr:CvpA family protein [Paenalkalicoccus suaedae]QKS71997.1 CvpA family protein [Paenalkalicoccus suaedae]